jgi:hypothetical protein
MVVEYWLEGACFMLLVDYAPDLPDEDQSFRSERALGTTKYGESRAPFINRGNLK